MPNACFYLRAHFYRRFFIRAGIIVLIRVPNEHQQTQRAQREVWNKFI